MQSNKMPDLTLFLSSFFNLLMFFSRFFSLRFPPIACVLCVAATWEMFSSFFLFLVYCMSVWSCVCDISLCKIPNRALLSNTKHVMIIKCNVCIYCSEWLITDLLPIRIGIGIGNSPYDWTLFETKGIAHREPSVETKIYHYSRSSCSHQHLAYCAVCSSMSVVLILLIFSLFLYLSLYLHFTPHSMYDLHNKRS